MEKEFDTQNIRALAFDVFGTVVDWRNSVAREGRAFARANGIEGIDWHIFADEWRALYQPAMERVRSGEIGFTRLDVLHRWNLEELLRRHDISGVSEAALDDFNKAWHRLDPWPDAVEGLARLKKRYIVAAHSNGNIALILNMAKRAGLPWDTILGAEVVRQYKPLPEAYDAACEALGLEPPAVMMVAAHNGDLAAARSRGMATAFVPRPAEYGPGQIADLKAEQDWDIQAASFLDLAFRMGC
jgi:2-haloacid dehalogenase